VTGPVAGCHLGAAADAGAVRAGSPPLPPAGSVPRLPGPERRVRRAVLAALRAGRPRHAGLGAGGRAAARRDAGAAAAAVRQDAGARPRAPPGRPARADQAGCLGLLPVLPHGRGAGPAGARRPGHAAERAVRRRRPGGGGRCVGPSAVDEVARPRSSSIAGGHDLAGRSRAGHRRGRRPAGRARSPAGDPHRARRGRQDAAGAGGRRAPPGPFRCGRRVRPAGGGHPAGAGRGRHRPGGGCRPGRDGLNAPGAG
jgi:hypothetical protein